MTLDVKHSTFAETTPGTTLLPACGAVARAEKASSSGSPLILSCDTPTTPRRSPRKTNRLLIEKSVGTIKTRREKSLLSNPETATKVVIEKSTVAQDKTAILAPGLSLAKKSRTLMSSSQVSSYYEGDEEFWDLVKQMEDQEVAKNEPLSNSSAEKPPSTKSSYGTPGSSPSSLSSSPIITPSKSSTTSDGQRRRKRDDSPTNKCPRRRPRPAYSPQTSMKSLDKAYCEDRGAHQGKCAASSITLEAAHSRGSKQDRPMLRSVRDLGHSAPIAATSKIAVSTVGVIQMTQSSEANSISTRPKKPSTAQNAQSSLGATGTVQTESVTSVEVGTRPTATGTNTVIGSRHPKAKQPKSGASSNAFGKTPTAEGLPTDLTFIAHNEKKQWLLDDNGIEKGVQYEIARGITQGWWSWEDITVGVVERLRGSNFDKAGKVGEIVGKQKERLSPAVIATRQAIYAELDREQEAFVENRGRGLGLMGTWKGKENWHGGSVQLTAKLEFNKDGMPPYNIRLNSFGIGKSNRAARRFTSLSILQVKYDDGALYDEKRKNLALDLFSRPLIICGRQYIAFCTKENKAFFIEINEDYQRRPTRSIGDHYRMSYRRFVKAINPMEMNEGQAMSKWLTRWQLILSTTRPVVEFEPEHIHLDLDDIYGGESTANKKAESVMTDGCGWINKSALRLIATITGSSLPLVVQGRIAGAKGLWLLHPAQEHRVDDEPPKIWIRASQLKIKLPPRETWDRSLRIFDLVRLPRLTVPSGLNYQTIMNMSHNGVKDEIFGQLMEVGLKKEIEALTKWDGKDACTALAKAVEDAGAIMASRRSRAAGGDARLFSFVRDEKDDDEDNMAASGGLVERDPSSGCPASLYESAREMLLAGFTPLQNPVLCEKLKHVLMQTIKAYQENYHIPVERSAEAFIAPDPYGVLEEGEIFFRCSTAIGDSTVSIDPHTFLGPVLVSRNPTRVASDVRKVKAVHHDKLLSYTDVIIFSIKGQRSLASYLGGGDYDGDTVTVFAEPALVEGFSNSGHIPEPPAVRAAFEEEVEKVSAFLTRVQNMGPKGKRAEISKKVLTGLSDGKVGLYSNMHDNSIYKSGYNSSESVRLAHMFMTCLDAGKSGLRIKSEVIREDRKNWDAPRPECMQKSEESIRNQYTPAVRPPLVRTRSQGRFVLDSLRECAKDLSDSALISYESLKAESTSDKDGDLSRPYDDMKDFVRRLQEKYGVPALAEGLQKIEEFIAALCEEYIVKFGGEIGNRSPQKNGGKGKAVKAKPTSQINHEFARRFEEDMPGCSLDIPRQLAKLVKASYAYVYGMSKSKLGKGFAFAVAHDTLCAIKVQAKGGSSTSRESRDYTLVSYGLVKLLCTDQE